MESPLPNSGDSIFISAYGLFIHGLWFDNYA